MDVRRDTGPYGTMVDFEPPDYLGAVALTVDQLARCGRPPGPRQQGGAAAGSSTVPAAQPLASGPTVGGRQW